MMLNVIKWKFGVPYGSRTRVYTVRGWYPRPLDEGDMHFILAAHAYINKEHSSINQFFSMNVLKDLIFRMGCRIYHQC